MTKTIIPTILVFCIILLAAPGGQAQDCVTSTDAAWSVTTFSSVFNTVFTVEFDFTLSHWPMEFAFVASPDTLNDGSTNQWSSFTVFCGVDGGEYSGITKFFGSNGGGSEIIYYDGLTAAADVTYHNRVVIDPVNNTYDYFVTPEGESEHQIVDDAIFRTGASHDNFKNCSGKALYSDPGWSAEYCDVIYYEGDSPPVVPVVDGSFASHWGLYE